MPLRWEYLGGVDLGKLTEEQRSLYNLLPLAMAVTDIGYLCEESADEFVRRSNAMELYDRRIGQSDLEPFLGLRTNAATLTSFEWALKHMTARGKCEADASEVQPGTLKESLLRVLDAVFGHDVWDRECHGALHEALDGLIREYSRGIAVVPHWQDGCGREWIEKIQELAGSEENQRRYDDLVAQDQQKDSRA